MPTNNSFGGILKVSGGRLRAHFVIDGERISRNFRDSSDAIQWLNDMRAQVSNNTYEIARQVETISFKEAELRDRDERLQKGDTADQSSYRKGLVLGWCSGRRSDR